MKSNLEEIRKVLRNIAGLPEFISFKGRLLAANEKVNLTRIVSDEDFAIKHIEDSLLPLFISKYYNLEHYKISRKTIDVGTGGGFPIFPIALMLEGLQSGDLKKVIGVEGDYPAHEFVGLDSVGKKMRALTDIACEMEVPGLKFVTGRAEDLARRREYRECYDVVTSRAVAELPVLLEYMSPFAVTGGFVVAYKSGDSEAEIGAAHAAVKKLSLELVERLDYSLSENSGARTLLVYKKAGRLDRKYPRNVGVPKKKPL